MAKDCENPRKVEYPDVEDVPAEVAWEQLQEAANDRDMDDVIEAGWKYIKAVGPELTYPALETAFRSLNINVYLIAIEKELTTTYTNMDLQGNLEKKYSITWRLSDKPMRPREKDSWPSSPEENLERLADAGTPVDRGLPKCSNCDQLGHIFKSCPEEKQENADKAIVKCYNCEEVGHRKYFLNLNLPFVLTSSQVCEIAPIHDRISLRAATASNLVIPARSVRHV